MGGRGATSSVKKERKEYEPYKRGQITKYDAGVIYRASKEGNIKVLPETTSLMYDEAKLQVRFAVERYNRDGRFYDNTAHLVEHILNNEYKEAQKIIDEIEDDFIKRAGKKSRYYKYKKQREE